MFTPALLILAQAPSAPAAAPVALTPERADARCLTAFGMMASNGQADVQRASQLGALYFYGKLLGRNPAIDLKATMLDAARAVAPDAKGELRRCGAEMEVAGKSMIAVGNALGGSAPKAAPSPVPAPVRPRR